MTNPYTPDTAITDVELPWETPTAAEPTTMADDVKRHAVKLATLRTELAAREDAIKTARKGFEATLADKLRTIEGLKREIEATEGTVRELALLAYKQTKDKHPCPGVEVKIGTLYNYDRDVAWKWAQTTGMCVIPAQFDEAAFLKIAKATELPFVTTEDEPKATISKDLTKALGAA